MVGVLQAMGSGMIFGKLSEFIVYILSSSLELSVLKLPISEFTCSDVLAISLCSRSLSFLMPVVLVFFLYARIV